MLRIVYQKVLLGVFMFLIAFGIVANENTQVLSEKHSYVSHKLENDQLKLQTNLGLITFSALNENAINVVFKAKSEKIPAYHLPSFANKEGLKPTALITRNSGNEIKLSAGNLQALITKKPFSVSYYRGQELLVSEEQGFFEGQVNEGDKKHRVHGIRFKLDNVEKMLGAGQRVVGMDRRGHRFPLYNRAHYGYETQSTQMNYSLPTVMSSNKYLILFDNTAKGWIDIGETEKNILQFEAVAGSNAYTIVAGEDFSELVSSFVDVTGKQPMPPRWALGNFASRFGYRNENEVRNTVGKFKALDIPLDAVIIDLYWFGKDIQGHMGNLDWDRNAFPNAEKMMADLSAEGVKPILITEPFILSSSKRWQDAVDNQVLAKDAAGNPKTFDFYFGNTGIVDVFNQQGRDWFNNIYESLEKQGVAGWWGDLGEPEVHPADALHRLDDGSVVSADAIHNAYGHQWAKMVFDKMRALNPDERPFILMRAGFAGSQRYGMIPWTGDVNRTWGGLKPQVELSLQMGLFGLGYTHSDLGGFAGGKTFDKELYIRWLQYGVFQPIFRPHGQEHIPSEVVFHDKETQDIVREFIKLRYQLLPYHYTMAHLNSTTGMPLMRPTFLESKEQFKTIENKNSYLWGDAFFVHPVVDPSIEKVMVDLPSGIWFNYFTGERLIGGKTIEVTTNLNTLPVFVRAGAFIPMVDAIQTTKEYSSENLTLHYYADMSVNNAKSMMYEDDGKTFDSFNKGLFEKLYFESSQKNSSAEFKLRREAKSYQGMPESRDITLVVHNWHNSPKSVSVDNKRVKFDWNKASKSLTLKFKWVKDIAKVSIN